ncbi:MAG: YqaJ viral recombinase family protein [Planctomycetota bacterium]
MHEMIGGVFHRVSQSVTVPEHEWLAARPYRIGASEAPIICGVSRFESAWGLYQTKVATIDGVAEPDEGHEGMYWGHKLEPAIIARFEEVTGCPTWVEPKITTHLWRENPAIVATLDAVAEHFQPTPPMETVTEHQKEGHVSLVPLEVKNVSAYLLDEWQDQTPLYYQVQVQHQMLVTGTQMAYLAALIGGNTFRWARVERDDAFIERMLALELEFLVRVKERRAPDVDGSKETKGWLAKLYPQDVGTIVQLPAAAVDWDMDRERGKAMIAAGEEIVTLSENQFKAAIADASAGVLANGVSYSYKMTTRVDKPRLEAVTHQFRTLRRSDKRAR